MRKELVFLCLILSIAFAADGQTGDGADGTASNGAGGTPSGGADGTPSNGAGGTPSGGAGGTPSEGADDGNNDADPGYKTKCGELGPYARFEYDGDCKKYIECQPNGTGTPISCPLGLAYDPDTESCTWTSDVDGCSGPGGAGTGNNPTNDCDAPNNQCNSETEDWDPMRLECVLKGRVVCEKGESMPRCSLNEAYKGKFIADKEDCASYYYCSDDDKRYKGSCTEGYYFDPARQMCVYKSSLAQCKPIKTSSSSTSTPTAIDWDTVCNGVKSKFIPDPRLCNAYIYCNGDGTPRQDFCPTGTYFNNGSCTKTKPSSCTCESFLTSDAAKKYEEYAPDTDKSKYYLCKNGDRILEDCGANSHYDLTSKSCTA